jgi:hypothetical protein
MTACEAIRVAHGRRPRGGSAAGESVVGFIGEFLTDKIALGHENSN